MIAGNFLIVRFPIVKQEIIYSLDWDDYIKGDEDSKCIREIHYNPYSKGITDIVKLPLVEQEKDAICSLLGFVLENSDNKRVHNNLLSMNKAIIKSLQEVDHQ